MAKPCTRYNTGGDSTNDSDILNFKFVIFCASNFAPAQALILALAPAAGPLGRYMNKNLQKAAKLALELFVKGQEHSQL